MGKNGSGTERELDEPGTDITAKELSALDAVEESLVALNEASKALGVRTKREAKTLDPFADLCGSPALDGVVVGKPILKKDELSAVIAKVRAAKTDRERMYEVAAMLAKIGVAAAKSAG